METKITKVTLTLGKKEVELTIDEAQQLKHELDKLFTKKEYIPYYPIYPSHWPYPNYVWSGIGATGNYTTSGYAPVTSCTGKNPDNITYTTQAI